MVMPAWRGGRSRPRAPGWLLPTGAYLLLTGALAVLIHNAGHPVTFVGGGLVTRWFPIVFFAQALVISSFAYRVRSPAHLHALYLADLSGWAGPLVMAIAVHLGGTDYAAWLTVAVFGKLGASLLALGIAVRHSPRDWHVALAIAMLGMICYFLTIPYTRLGTSVTHAVELAGDEPHYMVVTASLVRDHDIFVEDEYRQKVYFAWYPSDLGAGHSSPARDGHRASFHDIGLPLLSAIPFAIGGWQLVLFAIAMVAAWILAEVYLTVRLAGVSQTVALLTTAVLATSIPFVVYANYNFPEMPMALAAAIAMRQIWSAQAGRQGRALIAGIAIATLPWLQTRSWLLVAGLVLTGLLVWRTRPTRIAVAAPLLIGTLGYVALNSWIFGRPTLSPYIAGQADIAPYVSGPQPGSILADVLIGQARPWLDGYDGLLVLAPVFILALAGAPMLVRHAWAGPGTVLTIALYAATIGATEVYVSAGWGPPGRYMVTAMPMLAVPLALTLQRLTHARSALCLAAAPLLGWGLACTFISFVNRLATYSATVASSRTNGPAERLGALVGIPLPRLVPDFNIPPTALSFGEVGIALAVVVIFAVAVNRTSPIPQTHPSD
ncbi:MAG: hypothetical protein J2P57_02875 [Acidimicrobiaceae bacterium]|nr:hypothetical protein [Acidimicrobiaceae bacterium]